MSNMHTSKIRFVYEKKKSFPLLYSLATLWDVDKILFVFGYENPFGYNQSTNDENLFGKIKRMRKYWVNIRKYDKGTDRNMKFWAINEF